MTIHASWFERMGFVLRSGGALGADRAYEAGVTNPDMKEIFYRDDVCDEALYIASQIHPKWSACNSIARSLHARNIYQVLGRDLKTPVSFIECWTPDGSDGSFSSMATGGTRTAIVLAHSRDIPVFNLQSYDRDEFQSTIREIYRQSKKL